MALLFMGSGMKKRGQFLTFVKNSLKVDMAREDINIKEIQFSVFL
jgi:hypothetical protein